MRSQPFDACALREEIGVAIPRIFRVRPLAGVEGGRVTIYGDGSQYSRGKSPPNKNPQLPPLCIQPQPLTKIAVPNAIENDGTNLFYTDNRGKRHKLLME